MGIGDGEELGFGEVVTFPLLCYVVVIEEDRAFAFEFAGFEFIEGVGIGCIEGLEAVDETLGVLREASGMAAVGLGELSEFVFLEVQSKDLSRSGCGSCLVIECLYGLVHGIEGRDIDAFGREGFDLCPLCIMEISASPTVSFRENDDASVGEPDPLVEEAVVDVVFLGFLGVEGVRDGAFGVDGEDLHLVLVAVEGEYDEFTGGCPGEAGDVGFD